MFDLDVLVRDYEPITRGPTMHRAILNMLVETFADDAVAGYAVTERWECAMVRADAECCRLSVAPEGLLSVLADIVTLGDQDVELETFNREFEIRADDMKFANDLLDARMIAFVAHRAAGGVIETVGNRILVARPAGKVPDADAALATALGIAERVPQAVKALYPAFPASELTPRCPLGPDGVAREVAAAPDIDRGFDPWPDVPGGWA